MRKIKKVLRLGAEGLSDRKIGRPLEAADRLRLPAQARPAAGRFARATRAGQNTVERRVVPSRRIAHLPDRP